MTSSDPATVPPAGVLAAFGLEAQGIEPVGTGLIHRTWKVAAAKGEFVLQKINTSVFRNPRDIAANVRRIADHLARVAPEYRFVAPVRSVAGDDLFVFDEGAYRIFPFVAGSHTIDVVSSPQQAYEAARQFGSFTRNLSRLDPATLLLTIEGFHDLQQRYAAFHHAVANGIEQRVTAAKDEIDALERNAVIVEQYSAVRATPEIPLRVVHHDTKISNVLFDSSGRGLCVIDLDTVMPGYFFSDVGDMMRTCLSPANEEERDLSRITVRPAYFTAIVSGYAEQMKPVLTEPEKRLFYYAGEFMIYMQALRFLSDHLTGDAYYGASYEGHNLARARNQLELLRQYQLQRADFETRISRVFE